ncbi:uncharacterized protein LOC112516232 [Cynara cardunculus var. scolymus]|uniref:uncharacterized protein LOC112516232 n=1 Tax=Cynara cardunculus var. scolymus TaxID=59895 RepID=UPI000D6307A2|nr:uncharacterized protein LOC112516232 [Cynara cardunculus var. scolymus]
MAIEEGRFRWIHNNQEQLQTDLYCGLMNVVHHGETDGIYTIEFQKRGFPHAHILLFLDSKSKNPSGEHIDRVITIEIPNTNVDPDGFNVLNKFMIHGPCGDIYSSSPCMVQDICSKSFPKKFIGQTSIDSYGYPVYRRRDTGACVTKKNHQLDNKYVVPHNRNLIVRATATFHSIWFETNKKYEDARQLSYSSFPTEWVWNSLDKVWTRRKKGISIGRMYFTYSSAGEGFYMCMLLNFVKGCTSFEDIRTIDGYMHPTYKGACYAHRLLDDDSEWIDCLEEASNWAIGYELQHFFVTILTHCQVSDALRLWNTYYEILSEDITIMQRRFKVNNLKLTALEIEAYTLFEIESIMEKMGKSLKEINGMPLPNQQLLLELQNRLVNEELDHNREDLRVVHDTNFPLLNQCQSEAYEAIMDYGYEGRGHLIFYHGRGVTGKTFLWKTIVARLRSEGKIVLPIALSGIAALLLLNGRTSHSRFRIPLDVTAESTCEISHGTQLAELLQKKTFLIIWDEAPMAHRYCLEALDKSLRDILSTRYEDSKSRPFGGLTVVWGSNFRQILPVIPRGDGSYFDNFEDEMLKLPSDICLEQFEHPILSILEAVYPSLLDNYKDPSYITERAILTPKNDMVQELNECIMDIISGEGRTYLSSDNVCKGNVQSNDEDLLYSTELLNSLRFSGIPNHDIHLKVGAPVMLLRNINQIEGLCNGTRLIVTLLGKWSVRGDIISGSHTVSRVTSRERLTIVNVDEEIEDHNMIKKYSLS